MRSSAFGVSAVVARPFDGMNTGCISLLPARPGQARAHVSVRLGPPQVPRTLTLDAGEELLGILLRGEVDGGGERRLLLSRLILRHPLPLGLSVRRARLKRLGQPRQVL